MSTAVPTTESVRFIRPIQSQRPCAVRRAGIARYVALRGRFELYERPGINTIFRKPYAPKDQRNSGCCLCRYRCASNHFEFTQFALCHFPNRQLRACGGTTCCQTVPVRSTDPTDCNGKDHAPVNSCRKRSLRACQIAERIQRQ
jgi:hypothetical protein